MREILFRGKRVDNGEWVYGFYVKTQEFYSQDVSNAILSADGNHYGFGEYTFETYNEIDVSTLGQYTGLTDKNGTKIFEGDIIEFDEKEWGCKYFEIVKWDYSLLDMRKNDYNQWCEVIGNIYDNPELIRGLNEGNFD